MATHALELQITLHAPLLLGQTRAGEENSMRSLPYISGAVIRGGLAVQFMQRYGVTADPFQHPTLGPAFFAGNTHFLNAYPCSANDSRSLPLPTCLYAPKEEIRKWDDGSLELQNWATNFPKLDQLRLGFERYEAEDNTCVLDDGEDNKLTLISIQRETTPHISRTRSRSRTPSKDTALFSYEALAAGQKFKSAIVSADLNLLKTIANDLMPALTLGGSRSAGYGRISIVATLKEDWQEVSESESDDDNNVCITLLSDVIVRDQYGNYAADIGAALGATPLRSFVRRRIVGGFSQKWGLPLPQANAIAAGSVFVFATAALPRELLDNAQQHGLGERRDDGFGRIAVNWATQGCINLSKDSPNSNRLNPTITSELGKSAARQIVNARLQSAITNKLREKTQGLTIDRLPSNATTARLRLAARASVLQHSTQPLTDFLKDIEGKPAGKKIENARIADNSLRQWIEARISPSANNLRYLGITDTEKNFKLGGIAADIDDSNLGVRLVEAVLKTAIKKRQQKEEKS